VFSSFAASPRLTTYRRALAGDDRKDCAGYGADDDLFSEPHQLKR